MTHRVLSEIAYGAAAYKASVALRNQVLRKPLGLKFAEEELEREHSDYHLICQDEGEIIGCLILVPETPNEVKVRQVAVAPHAQRQGVGRALTKFAEDFARQRGFTMITLHARATAVPFYEKLRYERVGEQFTEVTIPHWKMQKLL
jgi:ribosomal protein S18 acetylase RimI-like enzyme